jgi:O-antigen/teichoic acid export membrane protein
MREGEREKEKERKRRRKREGEREKEKERRRRGHIFISISSLVLFSSLCFFYFLLFFFLLRDPTLSYPLEISVSVPTWLLFVLSCFVPSIVIACSQVALWKRFGDLRKKHRV